VATANPHKLDEFREFLAGLSLPGRGPLEVAGTASLPGYGPVPEDGRTFRENAVIKAAACAALAAKLPLAARPDWIVADDSGLVVEALDGAPGVRSARYAGPKATDRDNNQKLLLDLQGIPAPRRHAEFVCVLACSGKAPASAGGARGTGYEPLFHCEGGARGEILFEPRGQGGFGYDPLFHLPALGKTYAELDREEKNRVSHRGKALALLREKLLEVARGAAPGPGLP
jgi:XTP/dITP diphosphohydrolase